MGCTILPLEKSASALSIAGITSWMRSKCPTAVSSWFIVPYTSFPAFPGGLHSLFDYICSGRELEDPSSRYSPSMWVSEQTSSRQLVNRCKGDSHLPIPYVLEAPGWAR